MLHQDGLKAREAVAEARAQCAALLHAASPENILFTSSGTEALNLAIKGLAWSPRRRGNHIVLTNAEHPAVLRSVAFLVEHGFRQTLVPVERDGRVDPSAIQAAIADDTLLVCVHHANHDLGSIQPLVQIARIAAEREIPLLVDATASAGWLSLDVQALPAGLVALAPHRFHGPKGAGVLYVRRPASLASLTHGGDQELGLRAGSENLPSIVGAGVAARLAAAELPHRHAQASALQRRFWDAARAKIPDLRLNGPDPGAQRSPVNLHLTVDGAEGEGLVLMLDLQGLAIHSGTACVTRAMKVPAALQAVGLGPLEARCSVLLGPGADTTAESIDRAVELFAAAVGRLRALNA